MPPHQHGAHAVVADLGRQAIQASAIQDLPVREVVITMGEQLHHWIVLQGSSLTPEQAFELRGLRLGLATLADRMEPPPQVPARPMRRPAAPRPALRSAVALAVIVTLLAVTAWTLHPVPASPPAPPRAEARLH